MKCVARSAVVLTALISAACGRGRLPTQASDGGADRDPGTHDAADDRGSIDTAIVIDVGTPIDVGGVIDVGTPIDVGGSDVGDGPAVTDVGSDTPGTGGAGRHSYVVQPMFTASPDGGGASSPPPPTGGQFTLVVDTDALVAVAGNSVGLVTIPLASADRQTFRAAPFTLPLSRGCGPSNATYDELIFVADEAGLSGQSKGVVFWTYNTDIGNYLVGNFAVTGTRDTQAPVLSGVANTDPLLGFGLRASEPLPPAVSLSLVSATGESLPFAVYPTDGPLSAIHDFYKPNVVLRYDTVYRVAVDAVVDFAGNAAAASGAVTFTTRAAPPLVPEDGFESATGTTLGGASLLSGSSAPVLAGTKSLYAPGLSSPTTAATLFALRLALRPGDTMIRFSYQLVKSYSTDSPTIPTLMVGSFGGTPSRITLGQGTGTYSPVQLSGSTRYVSATSTAEIPVPAGAAGEIVIALGVGDPVFPPGCGPVPPPVAGMILDDLRVE